MIDTQRCGGPERGLEPRYRLRRQRRHAGAAARSNSFMIFGSTPRLLADGNRGNDRFERRPRGGMRREHVAGADGKRGGHGESKRAEAFPRHGEDRDVFSRSRTREELRVGACDPLRRAQDRRERTSRSSRSSIFGYSSTLMSHLGSRNVRSHNPRGDCEPPVKTLRDEHESRLPRRSVAQHVRYLGRGSTS